MRPALKIFLAALLAATLLAPAAAANPGKGNGNGGGKPSWAGPPSDRGGGGGGGGKPAWAGQGKGHAKKAEKAAAKAERGQAKAESAKAKAGKAARSKPGKPDFTNLDELTPEDLEGLNPAWTCKTERALYGEGEAFADEYGTNENKANAFGMCVSEEAKARDGVSEEAVGHFCEPAEEEATEGEESSEGDAALTSESEESIEDSEERICPGDEPAEGENGEGGETADDGAESDEGEGSAESETDDSEEGSDQEASLLALLRSLF